MGSVCRLHLKCIETYMCNVVDIFFQGYMPGMCSVYISSAPGHIVDCSKFKWGIYIDKVVSCEHKVIGICSIWEAYFLLVHLW